MLGLRILLHPVLRPMPAPCKVLGDPHHTHPHIHPKQEPGDLCSRGRGRDSKVTPNLGEKWGCGEGWWERVEELGSPQLSPGS